MKSDAPSAALWRNLADLTERAGAAASPPARGDEFLPGASDFKSFDRRNFLKLMGASIALASLPACTRQPLRKIVPYVNQPEMLVPGKAVFYATAMTLGGYATGLLVESHEGHPTKIEGNPGYPASLGATGIFHQAALLDLYDPDRSQAVLQHGQPATWESFVATLHEKLSAASGGQGLRILTETVTSPTLHWQLQQLLAKFPGAIWHQYEPVNRDNVRAGSRLAFGEFVETAHHFAGAKRVLSLDSDFLGSHPDSLRYTRDFTSQRRAAADRTDMNRLYVVESSPTITGSNADHRLPVRSVDIELFTYALACQLGALAGSAIPALPGSWSAWVKVIAADLLRHRGECLVIAGESQPPAVQAMAHIINHFLGNVGTTVTFHASAQANPVDQTASVQDLSAALKDGTVDALIILGGNPAFTAPVDFNLGSNISRAKFSVHLSPDVNETSALCEWHIPQNHFLETWSDARAFDGTLAIVQPLILPLYGGKSAHELLDAALAPPGRSDYDIVHDYWSAQIPGADFESRWRRMLHDGFLQDSAFREQKVALAAVDFPLPKTPPGGLEITFRPDPTLFDGRYANNGWLQELPKPVTKLVWDNAALIAPALAEKHALANGSVIEITFQNRPLRLPVWITPGQAEDSIALYFGPGRSRTGRVGANTGFDVYPLRASTGLWQGGGATFVPTDGRHPLVTTQTQHTIDSEDRQILREGTWAEFQKDAGFLQKNSELPVPGDTLLNPAEFPATGYRWGMAIDLSACIGCSACILACQSENNIPVIGKTEVAAGRIMHWIRVDAYFRGAPANPVMNHQPVPCMQCENAPCEVVCPVGATVHDHEGLNLQVYNRCVGTRYCSNNCPYKVRRFNFFQYADYTTPALEPLRNPDVTVRWRGVMEKCTYCLQRISEARIRSEEQNRTIREGEIKTACQQVCPAQAIVFGDIGDPNSRVARLKALPLNFSMLGELNTRPRTTYLAKLRNPNPELAA